MHDRSCTPGGRIRLCPKFRKKQKAQKAESRRHRNGSLGCTDKILYDRAIKDIKKGRHEVGRLTLQTLINTYPDSEYLADAKLAIADSYYKEGGSANLTQAIAAYKDFGCSSRSCPKRPTLRCK